jgi:hypothetical protein
MLDRGFSLLKRRWLRRVRVRAAVLVSVGVLTGAAAPGAVAGPHDGVRAETFMLPLGAPLPSVGQLAEPDVRSRLADQSRQMAAARTALETVGPAASYGTKAATPAAAPAPAAG